jgi:Cu(I)/Ag(I) efflux system protein CusF
MKRVAIALFLALGASAALAQLAEGEIRKVDKGAKKITIKHGPVPSIDMPPMTMVYQVKDAALLERVKAGDKVKFDARKEGGQYFVTRIEPAK